MVVFGQGDLWSLGISPSDIHRGAGNLSLSIAIIRTNPEATAVLCFSCICFLFFSLLNFLTLWFVKVWLPARRAACVAFSTYIKFTQKPFTTKFSVTKSSEVELKCNC